MIKEGSYVQVKGDSAVARVRLVPDVIDVVELYPPLRGRRFWRLEELKEIRV